MTDRARPKDQISAVQLPAFPAGEPEKEALNHAVRDHRRAVEETVEALKTKLSRATDSVEHAREKVDETNDFVRDHRWPFMGAATVLGLIIGLSRTTSSKTPTFQLMLPSGFDAADLPFQQQKKRTLFSAAIAAVGTMILREVGMRAVTILEERLLNAPQPQNPPVRSSRR